MMNSVLFSKNSEESLVVKFLGDDYFYMMEIQAKDFYRSSGGYVPHFHKRTQPENVKALKSLLQNGAFKLKNVIPLKTDAPSGIFSVEISPDGKRGFFAAEYADVFDLILNEPTFHLYEVIPENSPCHLYYDIEYLFEDRPGFDGDSVVQRIISRSIECLQTYGETAFSYIVLKTYSRKKFSRHVIIRGSNYCFSTNAHAKAFVEREILPEPEFAAIIDAGVYSRNRCFRMIWNSKMAKGDHEKLIPLDDKNTLPETSSLEFFMSTLICNCDPCLKKIEFPDVTRTAEKQKAQRAAVAQIVRTGRYNSLESWVLSMFAPPGSIKKVLVHEDAQTVIYGIEGYRFCANVGREHKSNGIYIVVRLKEGTAVQKCHDPDCAGFQSPPIQIPQEILDAITTANTKMNLVSALKSTDEVTPISQPTSIHNENQNETRSQKYQFLSDSSDSEMEAKKYESLLSDSPVEYSVSSDYIAYSDESDSIE